MAAPVIDVMALWNAKYQKERKSEMEKQRIWPQFDCLLSETWSNSFFEWWLRCYRANFLDPFSIYWTFSHQLIWFPKINSKFDVSFHDSKLGMKDNVTWLMPTQSSYFQNCWFIDPYLLKHCWTKSVPKSTFHSTALSSAWKTL